jgi:hypothetical protein
MRSPGPTGQTGAWRLHGPERRVDCSLKSFFQWPYRVGETIMRRRRRNDVGRLFILFAFITVAHLSAAAAATIDLACAMYGTPPIRVYVDTATKHLIINPRPALDGSETGDADDMVDGRKRLLHGATDANVQDIVNVLGDKILFGLKNLDSGLTSMSILDVYGGMLQSGSNLFTCHPR